jgi:hypothetical protein
MEFVQTSIPEWFTIRSCEILPGKDVKKEGQ